MDIKTTVPIGNVPAYELANDEIPTAQILELYRAQRRIGELTRRLFKIEGMVKNLLDVCYTGETQPLKTRWGIR